MSILDTFRKSYVVGDNQYYSIDEYLQLCKQDPLAYATSSERMLKAIGEPKMVDTSLDPRLSRIFNNRTIPVYESFNQFFGIEDIIQDIVNYFKFAAQGLEESKQILYLLGPVGSSKSSIAEHLKSLMQKYPIYILSFKNGDVYEDCPYFCSPLSLFNHEDIKQQVSSEYDIPLRYLNHVPGPWLIKRLQEVSGDLSFFSVKKVYPNIHEQIAISKTEPGDENNQDISSLVGKVDIRKLKQFSQNDPDAYSYSGSLCRSNQGLMEFVEMFKAPIKVLHPLLTATQEGNYNGTEAISAIPFRGTVIAHSNESEWQAFKNNKNNEAFLDRVYIVKVPYCLRVTEEQSIYLKMLKHSSLSNNTCAPYTLSMLAQFMVMTRLKETGLSSLSTKMKVYDGQNMKDEDVSCKPITEYREAAGLDEGMDGWSTRTAFKILAKVFNFDSEEVAANPIHLMYVLQRTIELGQYNEELTAKYNDILKNTLQSEYKRIIEKEIQTAYLESYSEYGQNLYDRYIQYATAWLDHQEHVDPNTGIKFNLDKLNEELEAMENATGVGNKKDFRQEIVNHNLRYQSKNSGKNSPWNAYNKIREVIERKMFSSTEELLPIISFTAKSNSDDEKKHHDFVQRMCKMGYTERQVRLIVEWYMRICKSS